MNEQICPHCGHFLKRDIQPMTLHYKEFSATFDMPGWYCKHCGESVHEGADMEESDRQLNLLRERSGASSSKELAALTLAGTAGAGR